MNSNVGKTTIPAGTRVQVVSISDTDPDEAIGVVGTIGELTHPFGDSPNTEAGLFVETRGTVPPGTHFSSNRCSLCCGDRIKIIETGEEITL